MTQIPFWPFVAVLVFLAGCIDWPHDCYRCEPEV